MEQLFDWNRILFNDLPAAFLLEVVLRSVIMFLVILLTLRASGKRGIRQLSIFELVLIIGLGSAAGDPMFYEDVGILPALTVFVVVILLYTGITRLADRSRRLERVMEGEPVYVVKSGQLQLNELNRTGLSQDELFSELRLLNVEHLGQVRAALVETSGELSVLFFEDSEVKPGLPIFPGQQQKTLIDEYLRCCSRCGELQNADRGAECCSSCGCDQWVRPMTTKRIR